jgi:hypothetical protein
MRFKPLVSFFSVLVLLSPIFFSLPVKSATIFTDDFESNNYSGWTGTYFQGGTTLETVGAPVHHGSYSSHALATAWTGYVYSYQNFAAATTVYSRLYARIESGPASGRFTLFNTLASDYWHNSIVGVGIYNDTGTLKWLLRYLSGSTMTSLTLTSPTPTLNTWYCIEVGCIVDNANGEVHFYLDGIESLTATGIDNDGNGNIAYVWAGLSEQDIGGGAGIKECYLDCVKVASTYVGTEGGPAFSNIGYSNSKAGESCTFSCNWTDGVGLSGYVFSTNNTGTWVNDTWVALAGTTAWANVTKTLDSTLGTIVGFRWYCNNTEDNWGDTDIHTLSTSGDWQYSMKLMFNTTGIAENLIDFPVLINLTRAGTDFWSRVGSTLNDLRFVDSDNVTDLYFEVEYWNYADNEAHVWVKVPQIDAGSTTDFIYLYYGNPFPYETPYHNPAQVWNGNFVMVHHLEETSGTVTDSTSNHNDGTYNGALQDSEGKIDGADGFDGDYDYVLIPHDASLSFGTGPFTISVWVNYDNNNDDSDIIRKGHTSPTPSAVSNYKLELVSNQISGVLYEDGKTNSAVTTPGTYSDGSWHHAVFLRNGTDIFLYVDGVLQASAGGATHDFSEAKNSANTTIGCKDPPNLEDFYSGLIDEVEVSNTARSEAWIKASYRSMTDELLTFGEKGIMLTVTSPQNTTYYTTTVALEGSTDLEANVTYSLDGQPTVNVENNTMSFSTSLMGLTYASHSITVYAVESANASNTASTTIQFTVEELAPPPPWACPNCQHRVKLTFDNTGSSENLIDFPVLIVLDPSRIDYSKTSATDIRFFDGDTLLPKETELWNASGNSYIWVRVPQIDNTDTDYIYAYYNCTGAENLDDAAAVWSGYAMVHHLEETSGTVTDSTSNHNDGTYNGALQDSEGKIDGADGFDGDYDYVAVPHDTSLNFGTGPFTISVWVNYTDGNGDADILRKGCTTTAVSNYKLELVNNYISGVFNEQGKSNSVVTTSGTYSDGNWHFVVLLRDGTNIYLYVDGVLQASAGGATHDFSDAKNTAKLSIGSKDTLVEDFFEGTIDEVELINVARSASWIEASHNSMNDALVTYGPEETKGQTPPNKPTNPDPSDGATQVPTSVTLSVDVSDPEGDPMNVSFYQTTAPVENFTIIVLPDTQHYSEGYPLIFDNQTQWIVDNIGNMNIIFVTHEGDIVDNNVIIEWENANHSMSILDGNTPWAVLPGNHDGANVDLTNYNTYFPYSRFSMEDWYGGAYLDNNANNYELFSMGEDDYLIFHFQYHPSDAVLAWANDTIDTYSTRRVIVVTHDYLTTSGTRSTEGDHIWNSFVSHHADQIFLVLCGHNHDENRRADTVDGYVVHQVLADYQDEPNGGNGWLRILEFHPAEDKIYVKTYSPRLNQYQTDSYSEFTIDYDMTGPPPPILLGTDINVPSGETATFPWTGLDSFTTYYWYAVADDSHARTQSDTWNFTTHALYEMNLNVGWNMVSFPVIPADTSFSSIFSGLPYYQVLTWSSTSYVTPTDVEAGRGYWVLVLSSTTVDITGVPVTSYELDLPAGWSMIGSIYGSTVDAEAVFPDFYQLLTWSGTSYVSATTIEPGKGYWALVLTPTHIKVSPP